MLQIEFKDNGKIGVFAMEAGTIINVASDANRIPEILPAATFEALRDQMAQFLDILNAVSPRRPKLVSNQHGCAITGAITLLLIEAAVVLIILTVLGAL